MDILDRPLDLLIPPIPVTQPDADNRAGGNTPVDIENRAENNTADKLLSIRKEFKKNSVAIAKTKAHQTVASTCKENQQTPKGLKINVKCSIHG